MLRVIYAKFRSQVHYAKCRYAECRYAKCRYAECRYAKCRYAECRGATSNSRMEELMFMKYKNKLKEDYS